MNGYGIWLVVSLMVTIFGALLFWASKSLEPRPLPILGALCMAVVILSAIVAFFAGRKQGAW